MAKAGKVTPKSEVSLGSNLSKLLALKKQLQEGPKGPGGPGQTDRMPWFKVEPGKGHKVRLLPLPFNDNVPFVTVKEHRNLYPNASLRSVVCPRSVGEGECPICEYTISNWADAKEKNDPAAMGFLKSLMPKFRAYALLYNYDTQRVEILGMSNTLLGQFFETFDDEMDPSNVKTGQSGKLSLLSQSGKTAYHYMPSGAPGPLAANEEEIQEILAYCDAHKDEILRRKNPLPYDELKKLLEGATDESDDDGDIHDSDDGENVTDAVDALYEKAKNKVNG